LKTRALPVKTSATLQSEIAKDRILGQQRKAKGD
jgi:hypothetical protein